MLRQLRNFHLWRKLDQAELEGLVGCSEGQNEGKRRRNKNIYAEEECRLKSIVFSGKGSFIQLEHK